MSQSGSSHRNHRFLKRDPALASRYLARTRADRAARRPNAHIGLTFFLLLGSLIGFAGMVLVFGTAASAYADITTDLPPLSQLTNRLSFKTTQILDRKGKLLFEIYDREGGRRNPVHLADVSQHLIDATIATEDKDFYGNVGFDPMGFARAAFQNATQGQLKEGASTITQQLVKNVLLDRDERASKSYTRKIREAVLALKLSEKYSKDQILEMYLNEIYYGHMSYGIEAAAQVYFGKHASDLNLAEASMLAGLPQAPSDYDPFVDMGSARARQNHVLDRMVSEGYLTPGDADAARATAITLRRGADAGIQAPHFVFYVRQLLEQKYGANLVYKGGLKVTTTLDLDWNLKAEAAIRAHLDSLKQQDANNAALVSIDPSTGQILAMVGSKDYWDDSIDGQVNVAVARRQPGSTIKPIVYATAFGKGWAPETVVVDDETYFPNTLGYPTYHPENFDGLFQGPMTVRHALSNSKNVPAVKTLMFDGLPDFLKTAEAFGITIDHPERYGLSLALGGGEARLLDMTSAYAVFADSGVKVDPTAILRVEDSDGNVLYSYEPPFGRQVIGAPQAYMITSILSDNTAREPLQGLNSPLKLSRPAAAKTGSTDDYKDSWTIGYTPDLVTGVWVGNTDARPMKEVVGALGAGRIWNRFMEDVHAGTPVFDFVPPPGIREYRSCRETGGPVVEACPHPLQEVYPETYTFVKNAEIPGLGPQKFNQYGWAIGMTFSASGTQLQPTAVKLPDGLAPAIAPEVRQPVPTQTPGPARPGTID
ncbi:MAG TPA: PBP1A family penicillin-binding protein [Chloroflexota bacterium]